MPTFSPKEAMTDWVTSMKKVLMKRVSDLDACRVLLYCFAVTFSANVLESSPAKILRNMNVACPAIQNL